MSQALKTLSHLNDSFKFSSYSSPKLRVPASLTGPSLTQQEHKDSCDINRILESFAKTGILGVPDNSARARYIDCTAFDGYDFRTCQDFIADAYSAFYELPSSLRARFGNDPGELIAFMDDPANAQEARSLGLLSDPTSVPESVAMGSANPLSGDLPSKPSES